MPDLSPPPEKLSYISTKLSVGVSLKSVACKFIFADIAECRTGFSGSAGKIGKQPAGIFGMTYAEMIGAVFVYYRLPVYGSGGLHGHGRAAAGGRRGFGRGLGRRLSWRARWAFVCPSGYCQA